MRKSFFIIMMAVILLSGLAALPAIAGETSPGSVCDPAAPADKKITRAEFVTAVIRETGLNLDNIRFVRAPDVRDVAKDVSPDAPYAGDLIVAGHYGVVDSGKTFRPGDPVTREEAASMAVRALRAKLGPVPVTQQYIIFKDADEITPGFEVDVQDACKLGLVEYNDSFRPGDPFDCGQLRSLLATVRERMSMEENGDGVAWELSGDRSEITLSWGEKSTGGYSIKVESIELKGETLMVYYTLHSPGPGDMVTQAVTYPRDTVKIPAGKESFKEVQLVNGRGDADRIVFKVGRNSWSQGGEENDMDAATFIEGGRAFVPVRYLARALGISGENVVWSPSSRTVTLIKGGVTVTMGVDGDIIYVNDKPGIATGCPVKMVDGRVYLPARFLAGALGFSVEWDEESQSVIIHPAH
ncbi:MAG: stalk domain-containing protein [Bacillota bacterium]